MQSEQLSKEAKVELRFHSHYNPVREAERFVQTCIGSKKPGIVIVMGPGKNYIQAAIANMLPQTSIYSLQPSSIFSDTDGKDGSSWNPESPFSLRQFLRAALLNDRAAAGVAILEWEPVMAAFPETSARIRNELTRSLATSASDRATVSYWARKWLRNSLNFSLNIKTSSLLNFQESPILLAAAGPGLNDAIPAIKRNIGKASIWALASAVPALLFAGIKPELILATDPGFWNSVHLRHGLGMGIPYAIPPSVCAPWSSFPEATAIAPLDTGLLFENLVLAKTGALFTKALAFGTAAGTALSLALNTTTGPVILFGLDFASQGIISHAKPYAFDVLPMVHENRLSSMHSIRYGESIERYPEKNGDWRYSRAFSAYAQEISISEKDRSRVVRVTHSPIETSGLPGSGIAEMEELVLPHKKPLPIINMSIKMHTDRKACPGELLQSLSDMARLDIENSLEGKKCPAYDTTLVLKALCPGESARFLAKLARGEAEPEDARYTVEILEKNIASWKKDFN